MWIEKLILTVVGLVCSLLVMITLQPIFDNACKDSCTSPTMSAIVLIISIAASLALIWLVRWKSADNLKGKCYFYFAILFLVAGLIGVVFMPHSRSVGSLNILLAVIFYMVSMKSINSRQDEL